VANFNGLQSISKVSAFSALKLLVGRHDEHPACKTSVTPNQQCQSTEGNLYHVMSAKLLALSLGKQLTVN